MIRIPKPAQSFILALVFFLVCPRPVSAYDWLPPTNKIVLLAINAHPDDEGIFFGGALPYYAGVLKVPTMLLSMTMGNNPTVRANELRCSAWTYGMRYEPLFAGLRDVNSGLMTNTAYGSNTINITWDYWADGRFQGDGSDVEAGKARAINCVAEQIRRYRPDVIITHDVNGEYGHDNHKATAWAVTNAFFVAADPNAAAPNLVGLPPWQAQKLYLHLYPTNRLFHKFWETPFAELTNQTARQVANLGLTCDVSQGPRSVGTVYAPQGNYTPYPSEWWGLYASTVGPDTVQTSNTSVAGYMVPAGAAAGNFLEHLVAVDLNHPPSFTADPVLLPPASRDHNYTGHTMASYAFDWDIMTWPSSEVLTFTKTSGPAWLIVAADGTLSGTPALADAGTNTWSIRVRDRSGLFAETTLTVFVLGRLPGQEYLMGWWKLDDATPPILTNSAPLAPDGVVQGALALGQEGARTWTGRSARLNGVDAKVDVPYSAELNPPTFTVALWASVTGGSGASRSPLANQNASRQAGYIFYAATNDLWQFRAGNGSNWTILTGGPVVTNSWIHLAATCDGVTVCFYTNGMLAASAPALVQTNNSFPLRIGAAGTDGAGQDWFPGFVDDTRIYRVALPPERIAALVSNTPPGLTSINNLTDGRVVLEGVILSNQTCVLLAATSLKSPALWTPLSTNVAGADGSFRLTDPAATNYPSRFYRITLP